LYFSRFVKKNRTFATMINKKAYRLPAEWEPQSGVQLTWPHEQTDWAPMLSEVTKTYEDMAREIRRREPLLIVGPPTDDTWARDHGFITLLSVEGSELSDKSSGFSNVTSDDSTKVTQHSTLNTKLLDFCFNGWGEKFPAEQDNAINRRLYDEGSVQGEYVDHLDFVLEGGSIESDGKGTIFTTSPCLLAPHRNQPLTKEQIEERLKEYLYADRILWIDYGQLTGDDTDGHIDTIVRIAPNDTLLYIGCDNPEDEQYEELRLMEEQLKTFRTIDGLPYTLKKLPLPRPIYDEDGERLPATYANFLIINGAVLCPTYAQPDLDAEALRIIGEAFPDREIVGIDCCPLIRQHGSLHCCTMQFPVGVL
jgi:agmatine/peptidylarginine deiminase